MLCYLQVSQALIDLKISHEEYKSIIIKKENYRRLKENIRMMKSDDELSKNNKNIREKSRNGLIKIFFLTYIK